MNAKSPSANSRSGKFPALAVAVIGAAAAAGVGLAHAAPDTAGCFEANASIREAQKSGSDWTKQEELYRKAVTRCPTLAEAHHNLGFVLIQLGRRPEAKESFQRALEIREDPSFRCALGALLLAENDLEGARAQYLRAVELDEKSVKALQGLAVVQERSGQVADASLTLEKALKLDERNVVTQHNLGVLLERRGDIEGASTAYRKALEADPNHGESLLYLGLLLQRQGKFDESLSVLDRAAGVRPTDPLVQRALGFTDERLGDLDRAEVAFRRAVSLDPKDLSSVENLAVVLMKKKQPALAEEVLLRTITNHRDNSRLLGLLGWSQLEVGKNSDAEANLTAAIAADASNADAYNNLGVLLRRQGKEDAAKENFETAVRLKSDHAEARKNLGE